MLVAISPLAFFSQKEVEIIGGLLGVFYFHHQQKLAEAQFFHHNFKDFNLRYDDLNEDLSHAIQNKSVHENRDRFVDYFNLCAEEFLLYQKGYIPNNVWNSWVKGMAFYWKNEDVRRLWNAENKDSYYGFNFENEVHLNNSQSSNEDVSK